MAPVQQIIASFVGTPIGTGAFTAVSCGGRLADFSSIESNVGVPVRTLGTFSNLYIRWVTADLSTVSFQFRVNSGNGNQVISIATGTTGEFTDSVNSDAPTAGQIVDVEATAINGGEGSIISAIFTATSGTVGRLGTVIGSNITGASTTTFYQLVAGASGGGSATEQTVQCQVSGPCTLQKFVIGCIAKGRSKADTVNLRKNAVNGNITVSITGTGLFEDTTHTDSLVDNDKVNVAVTTGSGTGTDTTSMVAVEQSTSDGSFMVFAGPGSGTVSAGTSFPTYVAGECEKFSGTESIYQVALQNAATASQATANVGLNSANGASTLTLRQNAVNTALAISITSSTTGFFQDATDTVALAASDEVNYMAAAGGSSGALVFSFITTLLSPPPAFSADEDFFTVWQQQPFDPQITVWQ